MSPYRKTAPGEHLTYPARNLEKYQGEQFCLRITIGNLDLDRCFFVYLDETYEALTIRELFQTYFMTPKPDRVTEMNEWFEPWLRLDPLLPKKYMLLLHMVNKVYATGGQVLFHINQGPGPIDSSEIVRDHLGTSVFADGSFDDKILDLVLEFDTEIQQFPELVQWAQFPPINTSGTAGPGKRLNRRGCMVTLWLGIIAVITLPFMVLSCDERNGGNGFNGGML